MARPATLLATSLLVIGALTGAAAGGWLQHGGAIFLAYAEAGLAWCF